MKYTDYPCDRAHAVGGHRACADTAAAQSGKPGGSCPFGYTSSGAFCIPSQGGQQAVPLPLNGTCAFGWTRSGSFCLRSGS